MQKVGHWLSYNSYSLLVGSILSHWKILSLYFLCAYPTIPHWPTHFVLKLGILLFVLFLSTHSKISTKKKKKTQFLWNIWFSLLIVELIGNWLLFGLSLNIVNTVTTWLQFIPLIHWSNLYMHSCLTLIIHWELVTWTFVNLNCIHKYSVHASM